jgi:arginine decarboxylase
MASGLEDPIYREGTRLLSGAFRLDHSTSIAELGTLFESSGSRPVQRLKRQLAAAYGMAWSFPSTHGTTPLNILALLTACPAGGRVLVNRDAHSSVTAALIHGGMDPVYFVPEYDSGLGLSLGPTHDGFMAALDRQPVDCVFLTSPNYFGIVGELGPIIQTCRERGLTVVVDAAHAPHYHFCRDLPTGAEDLGADFVTQSTHKTATALSQGSLLLLRSHEHIGPLYEQINELGLVSTSFSYPILASIELGVRQLVEEGQAIWGLALERAGLLRQSVRALPGIRPFGLDARRPGLDQLDETRVTLDVTDSGLSGFELERRLNAVGIYPEMATLRHVLFLVTPGTSDEDIYVLCRALGDICETASPRRAVACPPPPPLPERRLLPRAAKFARKRVVPIAAAHGEISGETIATYPPGVPIITAGEVLTADTLEYLRCMRQNGAVLKGASDPDFQTVKII